MPVVLRSATARVLPNLVQILPCPMNMPIIVRLATKADLSNRSAAVALRDFEPLMTAVGHQLKCSEGSNDFRSATLTGHDRARLTGPLNATGGPHVETTDVCI